MEAPEKIYFSGQQQWSNPFIGLMQKCADTDIEYTRTDAFIDNAEKWLDEHVFDYVYVKECGQGVGIEGELFDDFRNAMKGE